MIAGGVLMQEITRKLPPPFVRLRADVVLLAGISLALTISAAIQAQQWHYYSHAVRICGAADPNVAFALGHCSACWTAVSAFVTISALTMRLVGLTRQRTLRGVNVNGDRAS